MNPALKILLLGILFTSQWGIALPPQPLTLTRAMELAGQNSHAAKASEYAEAETVARLQQSKSLLAPKLSLQATAALLNESTNALVGKQVGTQNFPNSIEQTAITAVQPLTALGPILLRIQAENELVKAAAHKRTQSFLNAKFAGGEAFLRAAKADELLQVAKASLAVAQKQKRDGQALFQVGKVKESDALNLELALSEAQTQLAQAEAVRDMAFYTLAELTGVGFSDLQLEKLGNEVWLRNGSKLSTNTETLLESAQSNRAEIHALRATVNSLNFSRKSLWFEYWPTLSAFVRFDTDFAKKDLTTPPAHVHATPTGRATAVPQTTYRSADTRNNLTYGISLDYTLWDWGNRRFRESEWAAKNFAARENLEAALQATRLEVMQAERDVRLSSVSEEQANSTVRLAEEIYRQTHARFLMGMASVLALTSAERDQTRARASLTSARSDYNIALLKLKKAVSDETN